MDQETNRHLEELLTTFDVVDLGDGDTIVGANTLATMCCVLAGVARPESGILTKEGRTQRIGTSLLISGSASVGRIADEVLLELGHRQNNYCQHILKESEWREDLRVKPGMAAPPDDPQPNASENLFSSLHRNHDELFGTAQDGWASVLANAPNEGFRALAATPKFFIPAARPKDLEQRLVGLRRGFPLVHVGLRRVSDLAGFGEGVESLLDGCHSVGVSGETVHGHVLVTDPLKVLEKAAKDPDDEMAWLGRLLWLCDNDVGPELPFDHRSEEDDKTDSIIPRFREALSRGLGRRLGGAEMTPRVIKADFTKAQRRWTRFLHESERSLPGICGAARNLLSSLVFGLFELANGTGRKRLKFHLLAVESFARFLVLRMANARATMLSAAKLAKRQSDIRRIFTKLNSVMIEERTICKNLKIPAADCREYLRWLEESSLAQRFESRWRRVEGAQLTFNGQPLLSIDV